MIESTSADQNPLCLPWQRLDLHVPRIDHSVFAVPPLETARDLAEENRSQWDSSRWNLQGRTLLQLREWTRRCVWKAAREYTLGWCQPADLPDMTEDAATSVPWFVSGHQPALFHPGVWVKNVAVGANAEQTGGISLNLVVDNDTFASSAIRVPGGTRDNPISSYVPYDSRRLEQPWEGATVQDAALFASFPERVIEALAPWGIKPIIEEFWQRVMRQFDRTPVLAECLTAARNGLERAWGTHNLELPISRLCQLDPFLWFTSHLLAQLPRFRQIHNQVLREYRQVNRVRSRTHPVPDLQELAGWIEAPFWVWKTGDRQRSRLWAQQQGRELLLADGKETFARLPLTPDGEACCAVEVLRSLPDQGIHLRTRALTTTMFSRTCLADLFVHGIGGAKYDEMTDRILARFGQIVPPKFLALSATLQLPLQPFDAQPEDAREIRRKLRDLERNPERNLDLSDNPQVQQTRADIGQMIADFSERNVTGVNLPKHERREQHRRLSALRESLAPETQSTRNELAANLVATERKLQANQILCDREYAFCLHPEDRLQNMFDKVRAKILGNKLA